MYLLLALCASRVYCSIRAGVILASEYVTTVVLPHTQRCAAFVNRPNGIDFDDALAVLDGRLGPASTGRAQADFALLPGATEVTAYPVSVSRFSHTSSVSLLLVRASTELTTQSSTHWHTPRRACTILGSLARHSIRGRIHCTSTTFLPRHRPHTRWME